MASKIRLSVACGDYGIVRPLKEWTVAADGLELVVLTGHGSRERHWRIARNQEFDVCEFNVGAYFMARSRNEPITAIPVFLHQISPRLCLRQRQIRHQDAEGSHRQKSRWHQLPTRRQ